MKYAKNKSRITVCAIIGCLGLFAALTIASLSKYTDVITESHVQESAKFYFQSDQLTYRPNQSHSQNLYNRNINQDYTFTISIQNWKDQLNISSVAYSVNFTSDNSAVTFSPAVVNFTDGSTLTPGTYEKTYITVTVPAHTNLTQNKLKITAHADTNFAKDLSGNFHIHTVYSATDSLYAVSSGESANLFVDMNAADTYTVTWPTWLSPDNTVPVLSSATDGSSRTLTASGTGNYEDLRFFVTGPVNLNEKFTVQTNSLTAQTVEWRQ